MISEGPLDNVVVWWDEVAEATLHRLSHRRVSHLNTVFEE